MDEKDAQFKTDILASAAESKLDFTDRANRFTVWRMSPHVPVLFGNHSELSDAFALARQQHDAKDLVILDATRQEIIRIADADREKIPA